MLNSNLAKATCRWYHTVLDQDLTLQLRHIWLVISRSKFSLSMLVLLPFAITLSPAPKFSPANAAVLTCESNLENGNFPVNQTTLSRLQQARIAGVD
jgi:hypothetical protein